MEDKIIYKNKRLGLRVTEYIYINQDANVGQGNFYVKTLIGEFSFEWEFDYDEDFGYGIKLSTGYYHISLDGIDIRILNAVKKAIMKEYNLPEWKE